MTDMTLAGGSAVAARALDGHCHRLQLQDGALERRRRAHHEKSLLQFALGVVDRTTHAHHGHRFALGPAAALLDELGNEGKLMHWRGRTG